MSRVTENPQVRKESSKEKSGSVTWNIEDFLDRQELYRRKLVPVITFLNSTENSTDQVFHEVRDFNETNWGFFLPLVLLFLR